MKSTYCRKSITTCLDGAGTNIGGNFVKFIHISRSVAKNVINNFLNS